MKKLLWFFISGALLLILLWIFRISILQGIGNYLDDGQEPVAVQRIFVLGGGSYDRGFKAARLWHQGFAPQIICTGSYVSGSVKSLGLNYSEAELTQMRIRSLDVDSALVVALNIGSSTMEESTMILDYCLLNEWNKVMIVSDCFHTSRIRDVFEDKFKEAGIETVIVGAPSSRYKEDEWWKEEAGLIMVNNEYIKHLYYRWYH